MWGSLSVLLLHLLFKCSYCAFYWTIIWLLLPLHITTVQFPRPMCNCCIKSKNKSDTLSKMTYHDGSEPTSSSFSLQSHPGYGPQGILIHIEFTLKQKAERIKFKSKNPVIQVWTDTCRCMSNKQVIFPYISHKKKVLCCFRCQWDN